MCNITFNITESSTYFLLFKVKVPDNLNISNDRSSDFLIFYKQGLKTQ